MITCRASSIRFSVALVAIGATFALLATPAYATLACQNGSGDVVAYPVITNKGTATIPQGTRIYYSVHVKGKAKPEPTASFKLNAPLAANSAVNADKYYHWNHGCSAWWAGAPQIKKDAIGKLPRIDLPTPRR